MKKDDQIVFISVRSGSKTTHLEVEESDRFVFKNLSSSFIPILVFILEYYSRKFGDANNMKRNKKEISQEQKYNNKRLKFCRVYGRSENAGRMALFFTAQC